MSIIRKISRNKLFVSEPDPSWFGNPANEAQKAGWTNANWLKSRFHFSFAEYSNGRNDNFGVLRVMNDDLVQPNRGFGTHPHRDMEICTYIVDGSLTHKDSMGTKETLGRGAVQFMTAGTGVQHSEHNLDPNNPLRFIQMWIVPNRRSLKPNYGSYVGNFENRHNKLAHLVSGVQHSEVTPIKINQDANIFVSELDDGQEVLFSVRPQRQAYLLCIEGDVDVTSGSSRERLSRHESAELFGENTFKFVANKNTADSCNAETPSSHSAAAHILIVEMALDGSGRRDL